MKAQQRRNELRVFGLNACLAVYARRPQAIRKVYLQPALLPRFAEVLRWCAARRVGYRLVGGEDLRRLTGSQHHEGVCFDVLRPEPPALADLLARLRPDQSAQIVCLDGVGNPHNLGAILRSAAHFGLLAVAVAAEAGLSLSGAACRVAEGGAEAVPLLHLRADDWPRLQAAGFVCAATVVRGGEPLYARPLPPRLLWLLGAEGSGLPSERIAATPLRIGIPGSGAVESLNVSAAAAVLFAEHARQHGIQPLPPQ